MNELLKIMEERWDTFAYRYDHSHHGHMSENEHAQWRRHLAQHIGEEKRQKVLDVGAGTGFLTLKIAALGYDCRGLDFSNGMMEIGRTHTFEQGLDIEFMQGNIESLPMLDNSLDVITNRSLLWTLVDPKKAFEEWLRVLKPGGKLLCFCTAGKGGMHGNHYSQDIEDILQLKGAPVSKICSCLEQVGFVAVEAIILEGINPPHGGQTALCDQRKEGGFPYDIGRKAR